MLLYFLVYSLQLVYTGILFYFILKSFWIAIETQDASAAKNFLTPGLILILSLQAAISLLKTLYFQSWEQMALCISIIAMRALIKSNIRSYEEKP